jgi:hypothetical protein
MTFFLCTRFENNSGIQAIVNAPNTRAARLRAADPYYGAPGIVRLATQDEIDWHLGFGGTIIEASSS